MASLNTGGSYSKSFDKLGRSIISLVEELGHGGALLWECLYWYFAGPRLGQPVRLRLIMSQMMEIGVTALPIVLIMAATIGVMQAIQGIYALGLFGAESRVGIGINLATVREFGPLITAILVAGRSGAALAARIGTMTINQEIDALNVMGINPVRYLVAPALLAMLVMVPALSLVSMYVGMFSASLYVQADLGISLAAYAKDAIDILSLDDLMHGIGKSVIFAVLIALIGVINGASVTGGAEGVGKVTTRSVVQSIAAIVFTDMIFAFISTRI
jgi:phospholipid/cholesterol/gamma-HCH transport system permease protein